MKYLKQLANCLALIVLSILALFVILTVGYVIILVAMLSLALWLTVYSVVTFVKIVKLK